MRFNSEVIFRNGQIIETFKNWHAPLHKLEKFALFNWLGNERLKSLVSGEPKIVDFFGLPLMPAAHQFADNFYVVGAGKRRIPQLVEREPNLDEQTIRRIDNNINNLVDFTKLKYSDIVFNDYVHKPDNLDQIAKRLVAKYGNSRYID